MKAVTDIEIVQSVLRGNKNDFALLVDKYKNRAFNLVRNLLKNEMDAEEVLQDAFVKAYKNLPRFRREAKFSTWFYKIVYNTALSFLKSKRRKIDDLTSTADSKMNLSDEYFNPVGGTESIELSILKLIDGLPVRYSLVLILFYIDGLSLAEISSIFSASISSVKVLLHRARKLLREAVIKHNMTEELL